MTFSQIKKHCDKKIDVCGNIECLHNRRLYLGLGHCLCTEDTCYKIKEIKT